MGFYLWVKKFRSLEVGLFLCRKESERKLFRNIVILEGILKFYRSLSKSDALSCKCDLASSRPGRLKCSRWQDLYKTWPHYHSFLGVHTMDSDWLGTCQQFSKRGGNKMSYLFVDSKQSLCLSPLSRSLHPNELSNHS